MRPRPNLSLPRTTSSAQTNHALNLSSHLARPIASGQATSRSELARVTGLVRSVVYRRALPLATRQLSVELSTLGNRAGIIGAVVLGVEHVLSPQGLRAMMPVGE
jgi:hypothetical protein